MIWKPPTCGHVPRWSQVIRTADLLGAIQGGRRARSRQNMPICRTSLMVLERLQKVKYAGICTDMRRVRHFWRKVPEMRERGWKHGLHPKEALVAPELSQGKRLNLGLGADTVDLMTRAELHQLVDALPDESLSAAAILLRRAQDPVIAKLDAAPYDEMESNDEDLRTSRRRGASRVLLGQSQGGAERGLIPRPLLIARRSIDVARGLAGRGGPWRGSSRTALTIRCRCHVQRDR